MTDEYTSWVPEGEPRFIDREPLFDPISIQYLRHRHGHEGAHEILFDGYELCVYPDGNTSTRKRSMLITSFVTQASSMEELIGMLIVKAGIVTLEVDGERILPTMAGGGKWVVDLHDSGEVSARYIGGET